MRDHVHLFTGALTSGMMANAGNSCVKGSKLDFHRKTFSYAKMRCAVLL